MKIDMIKNLLSRELLNISIRKLGLYSNNLTDAAVLLAITDESEPKILLTKRSEFISHHPGEIALPGGCLEKNDSSNREIALREVHEELGLTEKDITFIGELPLQNSLGGLKVTPLVAIIPPDLKIIKNIKEVSEVFYIPLNYFLINDVKPYKGKYPEGEVEVSCIEYNKEIIWGLTARIILSLFEVTVGYKKDWTFYSQEIA